MFNRISESLVISRPYLKFLAMILYVLTSIIVGFTVYFHYNENPMFEDPATMLQHMANPYVLSIVSLFSIILLGIFLTNVILMTPSKRLHFLNVGVEFADENKEKLKVGNSFNYLTTILRTHADNLYDLILNDISEYEGVLRRVMHSYEEINKNMNQDRLLSFDIKSEDELSRREDVLRKHLDLNNYESRTIYQNRIFATNNILISNATFPSHTTKELYLVFYSDYYHRFDQVDKDTIDGLIEYSVLLLETRKLTDLHYS